MSEKDAPENIHKEMRREWHEKFERTEMKKH